jgi:predicted nuclease of restriction endonuclease-like (RecB) superfamily
MTPDMVFRDPYMLDFLGLPQVQCPASFVPVDLIQTGIKGAFYGTRQEA